jgi:hypothetical protein
MKYQSFVCYRLNPNAQELENDMPTDRNIDGKIFSDCILEVRNDTAVLTNSKGIIQAVVNLQHCYLLNWKI